MDLEIYDKTKDGVSKKHVDLVRNVLEYAGKYLKLKENTEMSVTFVNNDKIREINKKYRHVDRSTDVISFAIEDDSDDDIPLKMPKELKAELPENLGDIFICIDKVQEQAEFLNHSYERELGFLSVHGFLHLNGYDHMKPKDEAVMFPLQRKIMDSYGLKR
ncbi:endoribonuclease YbeY [Philodulcilactobacillus myokoensis]|uniref:Endoribonuclease YbeY n=1 Tax=Philodulcilactobacillus myokoensis TaxID=2929573 RepID=A0A9W6ESD2_9LACO|nr:rRNA maturation RNase YbeY [Philodulcilactobacillus myokoensis]GLB46911.1 endoribonuclease YbeY [Philodulcilactobacillus myokoensis]